MKSDLERFDAFLPSLLRGSLRPPSTQVDLRGGRRVRVELGDFAGHAPYLPGDDLRFLDWKALARSGHKLLRKFDEARHKRLSLLVDLSASMTTRAFGLRYLLRLWAYLALHRLDSFELVLLRADEARRRVWSGAAQWTALAAELEELEFHGAHALGRILDFGRADQDAVLISDFWPEQEAAEFMQRAAYEGRRLLLLFPRLPHELALRGLTSGSVSIADPEGTDRLDVDLGSALHLAFLEEQAAWEARLSARSADCGHQWLAATLPADLEAALQIESWMPFLEEGRR